MTKEERLQQIVNEQSKLGSETYAKKASRSKQIEEYKKEHAVIYSFDAIFPPEVKAFVDDKAKHRQLAPYIFSLIRKDNEK
jgi:hypothetical protein